MTTITWSCGLRSPISEKKKVYVMHCKKKGKVHTSNNKWFFCFDGRYYIDSSQHNKQHGRSLGQNL
jgi:hypothetical protein